MNAPAPAYRGEDPYVFVCYAHQDKAQVYPEIAWLQQQGVNVWYDEGIAPGEEWTEELGLAIQGACRFLYYVTPASVASRHCRNELHYAQNHDVPVVAAHLRHTELPPGIELAIGSHQAVLAYESDETRYRDRVLAALDPAVAGPAPAAVVASTRPRRLAAPGWAGIAVALLVACGVGAWLLWREAPPSTEAADPATVAVRDFTPIDGASAAAARMVTQDVRGELGRTSLRLVTAEAGADYVLSGSVRRAAAAATITLELRSTRDGRVEWTKRLDEDDASRFAKASFVARMIESMAGVLGMRLAPYSPASVDAFIEAMVEVFESNLQAGGNLRLAEAHLKSALQRDPDFSPAHFMLAILYSNRLDGELRADEAIPLAHEHVRAGLAQQPNQTRVLGQINLFLDLDYEAARRNFEHARRFPGRWNGHIGTVAHQFCMLYMVEGRIADARRECRNALRHGVASDQAAVLQILARLAFLQGRYAEAVNYLEETRRVEAVPSWLTLGQLARAYFHAGNEPRGNEALDALLSMRDVVLQDHVHLLALAGRREQAQTLLDRAEEGFRRGEPVRHLFVFLAYHYLGDRERAFVWLNRSIDNRHWWLLPELRTAVYLEDLRADERFAAAMARLARIEARGSPTVSVAMRRRAAGED